MCMMSVVMDYGNHLWATDILRPQIGPQPIVRPNVGPPPALPTEEREAIRRFMKLVDAAKDFDDAAGQPECVDPLKAGVLERIAARLEAIEKQLGMATGQQAVTPAASAETSSPGAQK